MNLKIAIRLTLLTSISPFVFADVPQTQAPVFPKAAPENSASGPDAQKLPEKITILGHELNLKEQKGDPNGQCIAEYIEADKTWENWTWMFSVRVFPAVSPAATAEFYAKAVVIGMQKRKATDRSATRRVSHTPSTNPPPSIFACPMGKMSLSIMSSGSSKSGTTSSNIKSHDAFTCPKQTPPPPKTS